MPYYLRRKKINPSEKQNRVDFVDQNGDSWMEYPVLHPQFKNWIETTNDFKEQFEAGLISKVDDFNSATIQSLFEQSPWYGSTANDIDWLKRVKMQSILQKYTTSAISSTINLPNSVSVDDVKQIYMEGWKHGLKGQTVYRDGCRTGVLVNIDTKSPEGFIQHDAPKRPKKLPCNIDTVRIGKEKFTVLVGLLDEKPYEVFVIPSEIMKGYGTGTITKRGKGVYTLSCSVGEEVSILDDFTTSMTDEEEALTRLVSTSLRHGANVKFICEQLLKTKGELNSFSKAIARVLKSHIPDGEKSTMLCDNCGEDALVFEEGCQTCKSCGNSKCS